jgi:hypothetical protein
MDWRAGIRADFQECADRLLGLIRGREAEHPMAAAAAHLCLVETHGSEGNAPAALRHYHAAKEIFLRIPAIDSAAGADESIEAVRGLLAVVVDEVTGHPYRIIDQLITDIVADLDDWVDQIDRTSTQRDWLTVRLHWVKALHAACNGLVDQSRFHIREAKRLAQNSRGKLPQNVISAIRSSREIVESAEYQQAHRHGLAPSTRLAESLAAPTSPSGSPIPCRHFDPIAIIPVSDASSGQGHTVEETGTELAVDFVYAITQHAASLQIALNAIGDGAPILTAAEMVLSALCQVPEEMLRHLIGAWRLIDTMSYQIANITGQIIDDLRKERDAFLVEVHHDSGIDSVPARAILRCLDSRWYPELNNVLGQLDLQAVLEVLRHFVAVEHRVAMQLSSLTGSSVDATVENARNVAVQYDGVIPYQGRPSYDRSTGTIVVGQTIAGEPSTIRLHDPTNGRIDSIWIVGEDGAGKSNMLRVILMESALSGVFCIFPSDPRNEHGFDHMWRSLVPTPAWISSNVRDTIRNLEAAIRVIDARIEADDGGWPSHSHPGILFGLDDADDVLRLPRGRALAEDLLTRGPRVGVGLVAVLRTLESVKGSDLISRSVATSDSTMRAGHVEPEGWQELCTAYRSQD